ncbi:hypothetical protein EC988_003211, partial [Linderina pennispora]
NLLPGDLRPKEQVAEKPVPLPKEFAVTAESLPDMDEDLEELWHMPMEPPVERPKHRRAKTPPMDDYDPPRFDAPRRVLVPLTPPDDRSMSPEHSRQRQYWQQGRAVSRYGRSRYDRRPQESACEDQEMKQQRSPRTRTAGVVPRPVIVVSRPLETGRMDPVTPTSPELPMFSRRPTVDLEDMIDYGDDSDDYLSL